MVAVGVGFWGSLLWARGQTGPSFYGVWETRVTELTDRQDGPW